MDPRSGEVLETGSLGETGFIYPFHYDLHIGTFSVAGASERFLRALPARVLQLCNGSNPNFNECGEHMSDLRIASVAWLTSVWLIGGAACESDTQNDPGSRSQESDSVSQNATGNANNGAAGSAQGLGSGTALNAPDAGQSATPLVDPQIISVLSTINAGAIERSAVASEAAQTASVRAFAQEVIDTRFAAQERLTRLVAATSFNDAVNVSNATNTVSDTLQADSKSIVARLQATEGAGFDALFLQSQLDVLSAVSLVIDERLLPNVESALLRAEVERVRAETLVLAQRTRALLALVGDDADGGVPNDSDAGL